MPASALLLDDGFRAGIRRLALDVVAIFCDALSTAGVHPAAASSFQIAVEQAVGQSAADLAGAAEAVIDKQQERLRYVEQDYLQKLETARAAYETRLRDAMMSAEGRKTAAVEAITRQMKAMARAHDAALGLKQETHSRAAYASANMLCVPDADEVAARKHREMIMQEELEEQRDQRLRLEGTVAAGRQSMQAMQDQIKALFEEKELILAQFNEMRRLHGELSVREAITAHNLADARLSLQRLTGRGSADAALLGATAAFGAPPAGSAARCESDAMAPRRGQSPASGGASAAARADTVEPGISSRLGAPAAEPAREPHSLGFSPPAMPARLLETVREWDMQPGLVCARAAAGANLRSGGCLASTDSSLCTPGPAGASGCEVRVESGSTDAGVDATGRRLAAEGERAGSPLGAAGDSRSSTSERSRASRSCSTAGPAEPPVNGRTGPELSEAESCADPVRPSSPVRDTSFTYGRLVVAPQRSAQSAPRVLPPQRGSPRTLSAPPLPPPHTRRCAPPGVHGAAYIISDRETALTALEGDPTWVDIRASSGGTRASSPRMPPGLIQGVSPGSTPAASSRPNAAANPETNGGGGSLGGAGNPLVNGHTATPTGGRGPLPRTPRHLTASELTSTFFCMPHAASPRAHLGGEADACASPRSGQLEKGRRNDDPAVDAIGGIFSVAPHRPTYASLALPGRPGGRSVSLPRHMLRTVKDGL